MDLDWDDQQVRVIRKGSRAQQWLPASPEAFVWIRFYLNEVPNWDPQGPLWWTLRRRDRGTGLAYQPMSYEALRAVFRRTNGEEEAQPPVSTAVKSLHNLSRGPSVAASTRLLRTSSSAEKPRRVALFRGSFYRHANFKRFIYCWRHASELRMRRGLWGS